MAFIDYVHRGELRVVEILAIDFVDTTFPILPTRSRKFPGKVEDR